MKKLDHYIDTGVALFLVIFGMIAYLYQGDDVTKGLVTASVGALLVLLNTTKGA